MKEKFNYNKKMNNYKKNLININKLIMIYNLFNNY